MITKKLKKCNKLIINFPIRITKGDEFALRDGGALYCKDDHDQLEKMKTEDRPSCQLTELNNNNSCSNNNTNTPTNAATTPIKSLCNLKRSSSSDFGSISGTKAKQIKIMMSTLLREMTLLFTDSDSESDSYKSSNRREKQTHTLNGKPARVRTVLNEKQLSMLRACYAMNSRPDSLVKEQLVEMTGLSPRVVRVWFQNKRCKDKKKAIEAKLQMQQEKVIKNNLQDMELELDSNCHFFIALFPLKKQEGKISFMQGIPLIASPPIKHESPMSYQGYEVTKYQPPWKTFSEFAMQNDSENDAPTQTPAFQHLVNQVRMSFGTFFDENFEILDSFEKFLKF